MPPQMFKCSVCGLEVSRPKSYARPDGSRACCIHEQVYTEHDAKVKAEDIKRNPPLSRENLTFYREAHIRFRDIKNHREPRCWFCARVGALQNQFYRELLKCMERHEMHTNKIPNPFEMKVFESMKGTLCLFVLKNEGETKVKAERHILYELLSVATLAEFILVCPSCVERFGFKVPQPECSLETLAILGSVYKKTLKPILQAEVAQEN